MPEPDGPSELWVCRHGATAWSRAGRHTGRTDVPLLPVGEEQARALGARLADAGAPFHLVLTSPLRRARATAALAGFPDAEVTADAAEWDYGDYEGLTRAAIRERVPGWTIWTHPVPGGETAGQVAARADRIVARVRAAGGRALLVAHGHLLRVLAARWVGLPATAGAHLRLDTGTLSVLGWERETPAVARWNIP
ncbi:MAG TPA: histidine phosphatase family protein [Acidimicrobiales bacterium]